MNSIESINDIVQLAKSGFSDWKRYGHVNVQVAGVWSLFSYSAKAVYERRWNFFECVSRGLIINNKTGEIVARPFDKFFNWGEGDRVSISPIKTITEKMDGSLGIFYRAVGKEHITTRGSFTSEQGIWATDYLRYRSGFYDLPNELTLLFEIIYPGNRIVVDYGGREDLVLLAARNRFTGNYLPFSDVTKLAEQYNLSLTKTYQFSDVDALIKNTKALDGNAEGYVVEFEDGQRFKFKGTKYFELHRLISNLTFKNVLREIQDGTIGDFIEVIPDEFLNDVYRWMDFIFDTVARIKRDVDAAYKIAPKSSRKEFAIWTQKHYKHLSVYLFTMLDGNFVEPIIFNKHDWSNNDK